MYDVIALGELLIDFTPYGASQTGNDLFEKNPGGAPANVLVALSKLGKSTAFLGMVGKDQFGVFLKNVLEESGVDTTGLKFTDKANTTLAFVHLKSDGDRQFSFYRNPGADIMLSKDDIDYNIIKSSKIFHFGSLSLTHDEPREATVKAVEYAKENGLLISYDPNLRPPLWKDLNTARENIQIGLKYADILKVSDEELEFITGTKDFEKGTELLMNMGISLILVTLGADGCFYRCKSITGKVNGYSVKAIDTTGAGDAFLGAVLYKLNRRINEFKDLNKEDIEEILKFANATGALATTKKGAIPAMPMQSEIESLMSG